MLDGYLDMAEEASRLAWRTLGFLLVPFVLVGNLAVKLYQKMTSFTDPNDYDEHGRPTPTYSPPIPMDDSKR
ncbi:MAG: hypothetical protein V1856_02685 [Candidatus Liptonbacteria bacterium]